MSKHGIVALTLLLCVILSSCGSAETPAETPSPNPTQEASATLAPTPAPTPEPTPVPTFAIETDRLDAIYNHDSVQAAYLYMNKDELEKVFKPGKATENGYTPYDEYGFYVKYYGNDTIKELIIFEKGTWETHNGISVGSTEAQLVAAYGQPLAQAEGVYTYYTLDNELLSELPSLAEVDINHLYTLTFIFANDVVSSVMLSRF